MQDQVLHQAARNIFQKIDGARNDHSKSSRRWVWELIQNAVDSTAQSEDYVDISIRLGDGTLTFEHTGGPFSEDDLAALITGGSNKPYESQEYTGQFGTGFLVTHILSYHVRVEGRALSNGMPQEFGFDLNREGNETTIRDNLSACFEQLNQPITTNEENEIIPSARFCYRLGDDSRQKSAAERGLQILEKNLPYVFGFAPRLRSVETYRNGEKRQWQRVAVHTLIENSEWRIEQVEIRLDAPDTHSEYLLLMARGTENGSPSCAVLAMRDESGSPTIESPTDVPKIFRTLPLAGTISLGLPVVINAAFFVDEGRRRIYLQGEEEKVESNRANVHKALLLLPHLTSYGVQQGWRNAHRLAHIVPMREEHDDIPSDWWNAELKEVAEQLAKQPLVLITDDTRIPAFNLNDDQADPVFPLPVLTESSSDEVDFGQIWSLVRRIYMNVPREDVAEDWQGIVRDWQSLGFRVRYPYTIKRIASDAKSRGSLSSLSEWLEVTEEDALVWLRDLLNVLAEYDEQHGGLPQELLQGILPNQKGIFCSPRDLARDKGIDERLKDIADELGCPLRDGLLHKGLMRDAASDRVTRFLETCVQRQEIEDGAVEKILTQIQKVMPAGTRRIAEDSALRASVKLLAWLAEHPERNRERGCRIPLLTQTGETRTPSGEQPIVLLPPSRWDPAASPFAEVFPKERLLHEVYTEALTNSEATEKLLTTLVQWRIAYSDVVTTSQPSLNEQRVTAIRIGGLAGDRHKVSGITCSTIPFLNGVLGATGQNQDRAKLLLGLLLKYIIRRDTRWREPIEIRCSCSNHEAVPLRIYPSEWLAEILVRPWIAMPAENGQFVPYPASRDTVKELIDDWEDALMDDLSVDFLTRLGFDRLDLTLRRKAGASEEGVRDMVADLVSLVGGRPEDYENIVNAVRAQAATQEQINRNRQIGLHIQCLVKQRLEEAGFQIQVVDRGYDFEAEIESDIIRMTVGSFLIEVKAAQGDEVKMSPLQAKTAVEDSANYVLCVVDLQNVELPADLDELQGSDIESAIRMVGHIGGILTETYEWIQEAVSVSDEIRVDNVQQIRYCVQRKVWESGNDLKTWIEKVRHRL
jgi:hypothetical protein